MNLYSLHPLIAVLVVFLIVLLPARIRKNKILTILFFSVVGYECLWVILFALGALHKKF